MSDSLTALFIPINYVGPVNASIGLAQVLKHSGHRVVFAARNEWSKRLKSLDFEVEILGEETAGVAVDSADANAQQITSTFVDSTPLAKALHCMSTVLTVTISEAHKDEPILKALIKRLKPDVIITDHVITLPSIAGSDIPWIFSYSANPLSLDTGYEDKRLPPSILGLPINSDKHLWEEYRQQLRDARRDGWLKYRDWLITNGCPLVPEEFQFWIPSPFANLYMFPEELDYTDVRPLPNTFHRFDCMKRMANEETFELPDKLNNRSGKLIYLSLGSMGSANVPLMKRLIDILAKCEHKFIVSKGVKHNEYELAANMWGERTVPQLKVLPIVDLVITHGGNNTVTESVYFGKPMIVLPLFYDQYDNAMRIDEKGFGVRLNPYECSESQLLSAIDTLLNDTKLKQKLTKVSQRIQTENNIKTIVKIVESLVK
ncbi:unnamed protein product [Medioppia subpectinata]|uniref:UDP-glycosyltransferase n=1 Tax=Medioppia subpectinata TaxID=1979941 RepID=A0A7R9KQ97_9ACAR|nr:unnamed protein product [Medioppia subpectinata]CAG2107418.1 unnamed protein product [Medioppia subpectinata]